MRCCAPLDSEMIAAAAAPRPGRHGRGRRPRRRHRHGDRRSRVGDRARHARGVARPAVPLHPPRRSAAHLRPARTRRRRHRAHDPPNTSRSTAACPTNSNVELDFALELADAADAYTLPRFEQQDFALGWKDDRTEVTEADRGTESLLAERILAARPDHALFGEEHGIQGAADAAWCWVIDPIDGTSGFVRGIPVWATLIALDAPRARRRGRRRVGAGTRSPLVGGARARDRLPEAGAAR